MSGVVPLTRDVVALGSRYMVVVVWGGTVETVSNLPALSGSSQSGGVRVEVIQQVRDIFSLTSNKTNRNMRTADDTRTRVILSKFSGGPEGREGE